MVVINRKSDSLATTEFIKMDTLGTNGLDREEVLADAYIEQKANLGKVVEEIVDFFNGDIIFY